MFSAVNRMMWYCKSGREWARVGGGGWAAERKVLATKGHKGSQKLFSRAGSGERTGDASEWVRAREKLAMETAPRAQGQF